MWLLKLAWKNLWRNKARSLITMAAIFFAVILSSIVSSLQKGVFDNLIKNVVSFYSGYIQVHQRGYWNEQVLENSFAVNAGVEKDLLRQKGISGVTARLESFALASSGESTKGCLVVGVSPGSEDRVTSLRSKLIAGGYVSDADNAALLSEGLARRLKLAVRDTLVLIGQGYHGTTAAGKFPIRGILRFGSPELNDKSVFLPLQAAQEFYGAGNRITSYVLSVDAPDDVKRTTTELGRILGKEYEVLSWGEMMPDIRQHIRTDSASMTIITGILYILICFGIFGTLLMMMVERRHELGVLLAIGMKKGRISRLLLLESVLTVISGCLLGILISVPLVGYMHNNPIRLGGELADIYRRFGFEPIFPTATNAAIFMRQGVIVLVMGLLLSLYPVIKIMRMNPVAAMHT
ncbi:MAG: ABC transporter permease [Bacteroidota bacterium]|nr:ABC transporter permease [Bacteroidota bacterium]MDP4218224.1 ABC transporter permease [Bacteroidota bacterium]MDP4246332.1 ABC transporter permease [Bacteroidota bacterium]MDP4256200.1 ABC transporter permease [Bacteroidota bacterium]MDP4260550.1 ABC transporter permease [Bacteroidota bacterium]